jgi:septal ring factor EnvC (AmiA/AmiB activator)
MQLHAQPTIDAEEARRRIDADRRLLSEADKRQRDLQAEMAQMREERDKLNARLLEAGRMIQASEAQLSAIEARKSELEAQERHVRGSLEARRGSMSTLLVALQRMGRNPPPVMITQREDALAMVRSAMLLAAAFPELRQQAQALSDQLNDLVRVMSSIKVESEKLQAETLRWNEAKVRVASLMETKKQSLAERQEELSQVRKATAEISRNVSDLNELLARLDRAVQENTRLGQYERQLEAERLAEAQRQAAARAQVEPRQADQGVRQVPTIEVRPPPAAQQPPQAQPQPKLAAPAPERPVNDAGPAITLAPGDKLAMAAPGRIQPAIPFHLAKARLPLPAQGRRVLNFNDRTQSGRSQGIVIETRHGAQITSPSDGWIMYAGEFRSYGQILIINAGGGYHLLLAGLSQIDVQVGQFVLAGEPVGTMAAQPKTLQGKTQDNAPVLYVEFRKDQRPIDPEPWWADNSRKVQG